jgi:hypothetical protein
VTITDDNGCENSAFVILEPENSFSFSLGNDTTLCLNDQYQVVGPAGALYVWQDQSVNQFFNIDAAQWGVGQHAIVLTATTPEGCVYADDLIFTVDDCTSAVESIKKSPIHLFPNPSDGTLNVWLDAPQANIVVNLIDMEGRLVESMNSRNSSSILWTPEVSAGIYQLVIESDSQRYTTRWVKN